MNILITKKRFDNQLSEMFRNDLLTNAKSINTINSYLSDLRRYFNVFDCFTRESIQKYKDYMLSELNYSSVTYNRKLSSLKQFNEFLISKGIIEDTKENIIVLGQDFIRIQDRGNPTTIKESTVERFLSNVRKINAVHKERNIAIIYLMANTGIRREEVCNMKLKNIDIGNNEMTFRGKGNKERTVVLNGTAIKVLKNYLAVRKDYRYHKESPYLFLSERASKLVKESINIIFNFYCDNKTKVRPHDLRHNYLSTVLEKGILSIVEAQNQAGHSSLLTTQRYTHPRLESMKRKMSGFSIG